MAAYVYGYRHAGYMCGTGLYIYGKRGCLAAKALRADACSVYFFQKLLLHIAYMRNMRVAAYRP